MEIDQLKYPIGRCNSEKQPSANTLKAWINEIEVFPSQVIQLIEVAPKNALNWTYRPNGWNVSQLIHHCADSHMYSLIRFKLALTENAPTIRPYYEDRWAELFDARLEDISDSLLILKGIHSKWVKLLKSLNKEQLQMTFIHPEDKKEISLIENIGVYAWHCRHHLAHLENAIKSIGKFNTLEQ